MLLFFLMLKWTKILLYLEQKQNCFTIQEHVTLLVDFLKKKKKHIRQVQEEKKNCKEYSRQEIHKCNFTVI